MDILITGSLAYDRIMDFPGKFADHILPEKIHILNVCFLVNGLEEKFGGTGGNIAYTLALLGEKPTLIAAVGRDFDRYHDRLAGMGLPTHGIRRVEEELTAGAYITTDKSDNQITGFNPGAMKHRAAYSLDGVDPDKALAIISPTNKDDMIAYAREYRERKIPFIFDPGQQIPAFSGQEMAEALNGAAVLVTNDYEREMIERATGLDRTGLMGRVGAIITTLGQEGCLVVESGKETRIPAARVETVADPTGAGDAFRAGLLKGLKEGQDLLESASMGATCASYCVECYGTQEHSFTLEEFLPRHRENYGPSAWAGPLGAICHNA
jgi:adenosine kinase